MIRHLCNRRRTASGTSRWRFVSRSAAEVKALEPCVKSLRGWPGFKLHVSNQLVTARCEFRCSRGPIRVRQLLRRIGRRVARLTRRP